MTKATVLYHANCTDGITAAFIAVTQLQARGYDVTARSCMYNRPPHTALLKDEPHFLYFVDFCYPLDVMEKLLEKGHSVALIDHHPLAIEVDAQLRDKAGYFGKVDDKFSGAVLTFQYFRDYAALPDTVQAVGARDLWTHTPDEEALAVGFRASFDTLEDLTQLLNDPDRDAKGIRALYDIDRVNLWRAKGEMILEEQDRIIRSAIRTTRRKLRIGNTHVTVVQLPISLTSRGLSHLYTHGLPEDRMNFVASYQDTSTDRVFSLRSHADGMDVNKVAREYNGGGHVHAAGFVVPRSHSLARW